MCHSEGSGSSNRVATQATLRSSEHGPNVQYGTGRRQPLFQELLPDCNAPPQAVPCGSRGKQAGFSTREAPPVD
jgi:hypothetical protein